MFFRNGEFQIYTSYSEDFLVNRIYFMVNTSKVSPYTQKSNLPKSRSNTLI